MNEDNKSYTIISHKTTNKMKKEKQLLNHYHRFLDEAGDMTF